jgi:hypothetical protein
MICTSLLPPFISLTEKPLRQDCQYFVHLFCRLFGLSGIDSWTPAYVILSMKICCSCTPHPTVVDFNEIRRLARFTGAGQAFFRHQQGVYVGIFNDEDAIHETN